MIGAPPRRHGVNHGAPVTELLAIRFGSIDGLELGARPSAWIAATNGGKVSRIGEAVGLMCIEICHCFLRCAIFNIRHAESGKREKNASR